MIDCKAYYELMKEMITKRLLNEEVKLCVFQVDENPSSTSYIKGKKKDCEEVGIAFEHIKINSEEVAEEEFCSILDKYNEDPSVHGMIIQLPIPDKYHIQTLIQHISPSKDVDGFRKDSLHKPCTPKGIIDWLDYNKVKLKSQEVCVLGRSELVGKPLVNMLIDRGATVISCNSKTPSIESFTIYADIVISAIGKPNYLTSKYFSSFNKLVIDVGINHDEEGKLCGDVSKKSISKNCPMLEVTPVPGGVGLLTRIALLQNTIDASVYLKK